MLKERSARSESSESALWRPIHYREFSLFCLYTSLSFLEQTSVHSRLQHTEELLLGLQLRGHIVLSSPYPLQTALLSPLCTASLLLDSRCHHRDCHHHHHSQWQGTCTFSSWPFPLCHCCCCTCSCMEAPCCSVGHRQCYHICNSPGRWLEGRKKRRAVMCVRERQMTAFYFGGGEHFWWSGCEESKEERKGELPAPPWCAWIPALDS